MAFELHAEVLDGGEQVTSLVLDAAALSGIDPASIDTGTFTVHVAATTPVEGLAEGQISGIFDGERKVTGTRVDEGRIVLELESGPGVAGGATLGYALLADPFLAGDGRNLLLNLRYTVTQNSPFTADGREVMIGGFAQGALVNPEVDAFAAAVSATGLNYRLYSPPDPQGSVPLVMWLHGNGEGGFSPEEYNNESQLRGNRGAVAYATPEAQQALGGAAFVLAPQVPDSWFNNPAKAYHDDLNALLDEVLAAHSAIDPRRIYVVGTSAGGFMSIRFAGEHPEKVAAVVPIAPALWLTGSGIRTITEQELLKIQELPTWLIHARNDQVVDYEKSSVWAYDLLKPSGNVELTSYDDVVWDGVTYTGHESWIPASRNDPSRDDGLHLWEWLGQQSK